MIINYGAFVSKTLDRNYIPMLLKYLELYTLTYGLDDILAELSGNSNKTFVTSGSGRKLKIIAESESIDEGIEIDKIEILNGNFLDEQQKNQNMTNGQTSHTTTAPSQPRPVTNTRDAHVQKPSKKTDVGQIDRSIISVEPTWIKITYGDSTFIFGVKVLPIFIDDDTEILRNLKTDSKNKFLQLMLKVLVRKIKKIGRHIWNRTIGWIPTLGEKSPSGINVTKQVILAASTMKNNVFLVLNKNNIEPSFLEDASNMKDLTKYLGWCSIVFADDVNQQASFCMRVNHGMCNMVPYRVLMYAANKSVASAYQEIDEIQNAVSSVFRMNKKNVIKILGEMRAAVKLINTQQYINEAFIQENTEKYLKNVDVAIDMFKKLRFISKNSDIDNIYRSMINFPHKTLREIKPFVDKNSTDFDKLFKFTKKVLGNSIEGISKHNLEICSFVLAYRNSNMRGNKNTIRLVQIIKEFAVSYRSNLRQLNNEKISAFRAIIDVFNNSTSILKYHDLENDQDRQKIIVNNLYVFLSIVPLIIIQND